MAIPAWLTATWGDIFSGSVGATDPETGEVTSAETKRRVFEANISKAVCQGLTREELNSMVRNFKSFPLQSDLFWWLHEFDETEFEGLRQLGGCPSDVFTPAVVTDTQVSVALEQERAKNRRMLWIGAGALVAVGLLAYGITGRITRKRAKGRRRR